VISIIWSSANKDGLTAESVRRIETGIQSCGETVQNIYLNDLDIAHCLACDRGWGVCKSEGRCITEDDFQAVYKAIVDSDAVVFVTAVYWHDTTECFKAFFDRFRRLETARNHSVAKKNCLLVACAGGTGNGAVRCLENLDHAAEHMDMVPLDRLPVIQFNKTYMLPALEKAGRALARHIAQ